VRDVHFDMTVTLFSIIHKIMLDRKTMGGHVQQTYSIIYTHWPLY